MKGEREYYEEEGMNIWSFGGLRYFKDCGIWEGVFDF